MNKNIETTRGGLRGHQGSRRGGTRAGGRLGTGGHIAGADMGRSEEPDSSPRTPQTIRARP
eukprot:scaffold134304_cov27-Tisochrysis_lutea.AAC.3